MTFCLTILKSHLSSGGFTEEGKSTTNAILSAVSDWYIQLENGFEVLAVFFDLQKAFDSVPHSLLLQGRGSRSGCSGHGLSNI